MSYQDQNPFFVSVPFFNQYDPIEIETDNKESKRTYNQVDFELRKQLLNIIQSRKLSIKTAADELGINYSTAKNIVRIYRRENRMNKLPKRVSKALEDVLKEWKKPPKKITRFIARKCPLVEEEKKQMESDGSFFGDKNSKLNEDKISPYISSKLDQPIFDFKIYEGKIAESWTKPMIHSKTYGTKQTYFTLYKS